jgi:hypothetical protein
MPFQPGQSGNPAGRPRGSRNRRTIIVEKLLDDSASELTTAAIERATAGDPAALRACWTASSRGCGIGRSTSRCPISSRSPTREIR